MDPNAALSQIRRIVSKYARRGGSAMTDHDAGVLFDAVEALDGWLSNGGFLPAHWAKGRQ